MYRILMVEDDPVIAALVVESLASWGWQAKAADDFEHVLEQFAAYDPQLVLMDISLPFFNGFYWCSEIRKVSKVPVIFLSSAGDNMNIVMAMSMGGDDFIAKPFDLSVLTAKISAMLRRTYDFSGAAPLLACGGAVLNLADGTLTYRGERLELTKNEFRILQTLMERRGRTVTRETLMAKLWESDSFIDENTLTVNIARLRKKLEGIGLSEDYIKTRKGEGYIVA